MRGVLLLVALALAGALSAGCRERLEGEAAYAAIEEILVEHEAIEGHTHDFPEREQCLKKLAARDGVTRMAEIGFNAGHSTVTLLSGHPSKTLTSFDLCEKTYYEETSKLLLESFEGQLEIICGDSTRTLPELIQARGPSYDLIHIDGGHEGDVPRQDILNSLKLAHEGTLILVDDCNRVTESPREGWIAEDVNGAWVFAIEVGLIEPVHVEPCNIGNCLGRPAR